jgi:hypothetical protein
MKLSSPFLEFCAQVRNSDPSILPTPGEPYKIGNLSEKKDVELANALLKNSNVTYLKLETKKNTKRSGQAMAKYMGTSKRLQRIRWPSILAIDFTLYQKCEEVLCCFLPALQESTSLKELQIVFPLRSGPSNQALENTLTHTQSSRSLTLVYPAERDILAVAAVRSGLKKNTTLRELTLELETRATTTIPSILTSLRDHPLLRKLCLRVQAVELTGLETVLLSDSSKITELDIRRSYQVTPIMGLTPVLQALARRPALTKLGLNNCLLDCDGARLLPDSIV